jgi:hypothetical protein
MALPEPYHDHYPYERYGADLDTANILRRQDHRITDLQYENLQLQNEIYQLRVWSNKAKLILDANGIDVDETWSAMTATEGIFDEQRK